jgi:hypothetical protein
MAKASTDRDCGVRIYRVTTLLDVLNDALLVDHERGALNEIVLDALTGKLIEGLHDPVPGRDLAIHIAQQGKGDSDLLRESRIRSRAIKTDAENHRIIFREPGQISLIGLKFLSSTGSKGENIKGQHHVLFASIIAQLDRFPRVT